MSQASSENLANATVNPESAYNRPAESDGQCQTTQQTGTLRQAIDSVRAGYDSNDMFNRRVGYCRNCNSNVVHVRAFESRLAYQLDRISFGVLGLLRIGPWRCVDCGQRRMTIERTRSSVRVVSENEPMPDEEAAVSNFLRTDKSLAHASSDTRRFSDKFRFGIVEKLLEGKTTISQCCSDLDVSELELQLWVRDYVEHQTQKAAARGAGGLIVADGDDANEPQRQPHDSWDVDEQDAGIVIESVAKRKPK